MKLVLTIGSIILSFATLFLGFAFLKVQGIRIIQKEDTLMKHQQRFTMSNQLLGMELFFSRSGFNFSYTLQNKKVFTNERMAAKSN